MREPSEAQVIAGIVAAERESQAWSIEQLADGSCKVDDTNRFSLPGIEHEMLLRTVTRREFANLQAGRDFVKYRVWRAGIMAAVNA